MTTPFGSLPMSPYARASERIGQPRTAKSPADRTGGGASHRPKSDYNIPHGRRQRLSNMANCAVSAT